MKNTFIVIDTDAGRKASISAILSACGYVIPVDSVDDIAPRWPERAWLIVSSDEGLAEAALRRLSELGQFYPLVMFGETLSVERVSGMLQNGLVGTLPHPFSTDAACALFRRLDGVAERQSSTFEDGQAAMRKIAILSAREAQVLRLVSEGRSNKQISFDLGISPRTVEIHRASGIAKLEVPNSFAAARLFFQAYATEALGQFADDEPLPLPMAA